MTPSVMNSMRLHHFRNQGFKIRYHKSAISAEVLSMTVKSRLKIIKMLYHPQLSLLLVNAEHLH